MFVSYRTHPVSTTLAHLCETVPQMLVIRIFPRLTIQEQGLPPEDVHGVHHHQGHHELENTQQRQAPVHRNYGYVFQKDR